MKTVTYKNVHNHFKFNGVHLGREQLCTVAYSFIKEGADFQKALSEGPPVVLASSLVFSE